MRCNHIELIREDVFEKDAALTHRRPVKIEEPSEKMATAVIRGLVATLERRTARCGFR